MRPARRHTPQRPHLTSMKTLPGPQPSYDGLPATSRCSLDTTPRPHTRCPTEVPSSPDRVRTRPPCKHRQSGALSSSIFPSGTTVDHILPWSFFRCAVPHHLCSLGYLLPLLLSFLVVHQLLAAVVVSVTFLVVFADLGQPHRVTMNQIQPDDQSPSRRHHERPLPCLDPRCDPPRRTHHDVVRPGRPPTSPCHSLVPQSPCLPSESQREEPEPDPRSGPLCDQPLTRPTTVPLLSSFPPAAVPGGPALSRSQWGSRCHSSSEPGAWPAHATTAIQFAAAPVAAAGPHPRTLLPQDTVLDRQHSSQRQS